MLIRSSAFRIRSAGYSHGKAISEENGKPDHLGGLADAIQSVAAEKQKKKLEEWREKNCDRIAWDLFTLIEGPKLVHPNNYRDRDDYDGPFAA